MLDLFFYLNLSGAQELLLLKSLHSCGCVYSFFVIAPLDVILFHFIVVVDLDVILFHLIVVVDDARGDIGNLYQCLVPWVGPPDVWTGYAGLLDA